MRESVVTVLGFTFKEDVPDLRNTRVIDIVTELQSYGINVQVTDPYADSDEAHHEYGIHLTDEQALMPAQVVILAVPHKHYLEAGWDLISRHLDNGTGGVIDVKARLDRDTVPDSISLWRL